jgi:hypothetical protein
MSTTEAFNGVNSAAGKRYLAPIMLDEETEEFNH